MIYFALGFFLGLVGGLAAEWLSRPEPRRKPVSISIRIGPTKEQANG